MEAIMTNPILHEPATRLVKQVEAIKANQNFQDQATRIVQLTETLIADENIRRHARRIAGHMEKTDGGPSEVMEAIMTNPILHEPAGHHGYDLARARGRGRALPDWRMGHGQLRAAPF